ncbi:MAG: MscL family protein [Methanomassiliicoccales archaeon]|jgi:large conductance mechanosensitive channel|nr:MscL family protein [Methanomassiliicoccales archaeon]
MEREDKLLEELRRIREILEPKPAPPPPKGFRAEFIDFLSKYKVIGLAVAFIMGVYLGVLVQALVKDLLMPLIGLALPGLENLSTFTVQVGSQYFGIGDFLVALITFIIVALVIFLIVKMTAKWKLQ